VDKYICNHGIKELYRRNATGENINADVEEEVDNLVRTELFSAMNEVAPAFTHFYAENFGA